MPQAKRDASDSKSSAGNSSGAGRSAGGSKPGGSKAAGSSRAAGASKAAGSSRTAGARAAGSSRTAGAKAAGSTRTAGAKAAGTRATAKQTRGANSARAANAARATAGAGRASGQAGTGRQPVVDPARIEAVANRLRKLNERIIDAGREAGESTLTNYERALKAIASGIEKGPGRSDIDWISHLATSQAKFIRDLTQTWTAAARDMLK